MKEKVFTLINKGMNRDLSVSKVGESCVYENHNIRITATDRDTLLSVTNERGTRQVSLGSTIVGTVIGWNVLNNHIIIFTQATAYSRIYRIDYYNDQFVMVRGKYGDGASAAEYETDSPLYIGHLGFDTSHPIDSVVYAESDDIQKIYWVDGKNVLRSVNITAGLDEVHSWTSKSFDCNQAINFGINVSINKTDGGVSRPNGVVQYLLTYYNKHGQESGYVWISDIVYLSPSEVGGSADGTNTNKTTLEITFPDSNIGYTHFKVYSIFRSSIDAETVCYLVADRKIANGVVTVIDDGAHLTVQDADKLLYLGSQAVIAGTIAFKDQTLFLGDISSIGNKVTDELLLRIRQNTRNNEYGTSTAITFMYSTDQDELADIPHPVDSGNYSYDSQLQLTSSNIMTFKGGEKYRFAIKFQRKDGTETDAFWIGDKVNTLYPYINKETGKIKRVVARCILPSQIMSYINEHSTELGFKTVRLMIAEASYADRLVKAQGIVNPTMFNVWERFNDRVFSSPSWVSRVRGGNLPYKHFDVVDKCTSSYGEIQCNYWESEDKKTPYYRINETNGKYTEEFEGRNTFDLLMIAYTFRYWRENAVDVVYWCEADVYEIYNCESGYLSSAKTIELPTSYSGSGWEKETIDGISWDVKTKTSSEHWNLRHCSKSFYGRATMDHGTARSNLYNQVKRYLAQDLSISELFIVSYSPFREWCDNIQNGSVSKNTKHYHNGNDLRREAFIDFSTALNYNRQDTSWQRWFDMSDSSAASTVESDPAYYKKHLMFVDENVVTLDSPEISKSLVSFAGSGYKFRIVGAVKMTSVTADYTVDANGGHLSGGNIDSFNFSSRFKDNPANEGIVAWPLLREKGLKCTDESIDVKKRTSDNYTMDNVTDVVRYWLYMWNHSGNITEYNDSDNPDFNVLNHKIFANLKFGYSTIYLNNNIYAASITDAITSSYEVDSESITSVPFASEQYNILKSIDFEGNTKNRYYIGSGRSQLTLPGIMKYPICLSDVSPSSVGHITSDAPYLYSQSPVTMGFLSDTHAMINLRSSIVNGVYKDVILPKFYETDEVSIPAEDTVSHITGAIVPWIDSGKNLKPVVYVTIDNVPETPEFTLSSDGQNFELTFDSRSGSTATNRRWYDAMIAGFSASDSEDVYIRIRTSSVYYLVNAKDYVCEGYGTETTHLIIPKSNVLYSVTSLDADINVETILVTSNYDTTLSGVSINGHQKGFKLSLKTNALTSYTVTNNGLVAYDVVQQDIREIQNSSVIQANSESSDTVRRGDRYMLIGEIYTDPTGNEYGGISDSAVENNRFITAGPAYQITNGNAITIYGNQGDAYFQRYDSMRIRPYGNEPENGVIDIVSAMLETHINLDGRTDKYRYSKEIASFDPSKFGSINTVYSQQNNFIVRRTSNDNTDAYRSYITWTLEKKDLADVDEWTHITLANSFKLDSDKGPCTALRRLGNSLIAFQDKAISEILFNSRTQLSTEQGVPVELANSGKVDGKRYITNKYGCTDKQSIVEGKNALYFVDSINKTFCSFNGEAIDNLSTRLGFDVWFRNHVATEIKAFYDGRFSDVYLVKKDDATSSPTLCYNEVLGVFTSFYDYFAVPMMANIYDRFVSVRNNNLWLNNEGSYCNFYGVQKPFWIQYRVTPDPFGDKIWTNLEYRADFSRVLTNGQSSVPSEPTVDTNTGFIYEENVTFDKIRFWNEYQTTPMDGNCSPIKKFRTWRLAIPRAIPDETHNIDGLDRIRNPWINILLKKTYVNSSDITTQDVMQLHDVTVHYYE